MLCCGDSEFCYIPLKSVDGFILVVTHMAKLRLQVCLTCSGQQLQPQCRLFCLSQAGVGWRAARGLGSVYTQGLRVPSSGSPSWHSSFAVQWPCFPWLFPLVTSARGTTERDLPVRRFITPPYTAAVLVLREKQPKGELTHASRFLHIFTPLQNISVFILRHAQ